jgi:DNA-binding Xre family transcriptional regulator
MKKTATKKRTAQTGSRLTDVLAEEGLLEDAEAAAIKRVIAWQLDKSMKEQRMTKHALAQRMSTSRSQLDRLLDPDNATIQLDTVARAARALGKQLQIKLVTAR